MDRPLRALIFLRGAFNLLFAIYLLLQPMILGRAGQNGYYALGDGAIALALAFALMRDSRRSWLFVLTLFDGLARLALGAFIFANPGLLAGALAGAIMFTLIIIVMSTLGAAGMIVGLIGQPVSDNGAMRRVRSWPVFIAGLCTLLFGVALIVGPPGADNNRVILCAYAFAFGLTLLYQGVRLPALRAQFG